MVSMPLRPYVPMRPAPAGWVLDERGPLMNHLRSIAAAAVAFGWALASYSSDSALPSTPAEATANVASTATPASGQLASFGREPSMVSSDFNHLNVEGQAALASAVRPVVEHLIGET
jgi:hypothetical protein